MPPGERRLATVVAVLAGALSLAVAVPAGADWDRFRGGQRQTGVAEGALPASPEPVWTFQAGELGFEATAAIADGTVYVPDLEGRLYALDLRTGKERWRIDVGEDVKSSPLVAGGTVYFGDEAGRVHARDAKTGAERWTFTAGGPVSGGLNLGGDGAKACLLAGSYDNSLYCLDPATGKARWQVETAGYVHGSPAIHEGTAMMSGCDGELRMVDLATGAVKHTLTVGSYVAASPAVRDGRLIVGTFDNQVVGVSLGGEPKVLWRYDHPLRDFAFYSSAALTADRAVVGGRDKLVHGLDPATGEKVWTHTARARVDGSPVVVGQRAFVGDESGQLMALDLGSGELVWSFESGQGFKASPAVADGYLVIGDVGGTLYAFSAPKR